MSPRGIALASAAALLAAGAGLAVPLAGTVEATAIVAVDEPSAALRAAAARSGARLAVSRLVAARAASLIGTDPAALEATWLERFGTMVGLAKPKTAASRLSEALERAISAQAEDGLVELRARASEATAATRYVTAAAEALVAAEDAATATAVRRRENDAADRLDALRASARGARERLVALGAAETEPADALAAAAAATRAAENRLAAVRAVIAAGSPPLGGGSELPADAAGLQGTYWDLRKQLDKATETLGERHTTVVALREGVSRAAAALVAEWRKIERAAAGAADVARSREAVLRRTAINPDGAKQAAIDEARRALRRALSALAAPAPAAIEVAAPFRLVSIGAPTQGEAPGARLTLVGGAAALAFALALLPLRRRRRPDAVPDAEFAEAPLAAEQQRAVAPEPVGRETGGGADTSSPDVLAMPFAPPGQTAPEPSIGPVGRAAGGGGDLARPCAHAALGADLRGALRDIVGSVEAWRAAPGLPTVMVAANAAETDTGPVALALGELAAELGYRVLLIEAERRRPSLAAAVLPDGEPFLVEVFGALRVALPSETTVGLTLAPALRDGDRIAAALARNTQAAMVDDPATTFDLVVIDGGRAADVARAGWHAHRYLRVGRAVSHDEDRRLLDVLAAAPDVLLGTVAAGRFVPAERAAVSERLEVVAGMRSPLRAAPGSAVRRGPAPALAPVRSASRRRVAAR